MDLVPTTMVLGRYDPDTDPVNAVLLDRIAEQMAGLDTAAGALRIERISMPPHDDGRWRTYTNVIFANGRLVVPTYPDRCPDRDREALATWAHLLPDWEVVAVDASDLVRKHGALHCVTLNVPDLAEGPPAEEPARSPDPWAGPGPEARGMATD